MEPKIGFWQRYAAMLKMMMIGILVLLLLIPSFMIRELIRERKYNQQEVINEVGSKWGREQIISGPVISVPFVIGNPNQNNGIQYIHYLPETVTIDGSLKARYRNRNIFKVIGYQGDLIIKGQLTKPDLSAFGAKTQNGIDPNGIIIQLPIADLKGIKNRVELIVNGQRYEMNPGLYVNDISTSGLWCKVNLAQIFGDKQHVDYEVHLSKLFGTQRLSFLPLGKETNVMLKSDWKSPKFDGNFLPEYRKINDSGFSATWKILHLNRNFPQSFIGSLEAVNTSEFGVSFIQPVDHYLMSERSAKYAILFISLTFLTFFFSEITNRRKIHPIQYILIGLALVLFFSLLLSLSEQIGFDKAYFVAAAAIILMVFMYAWSILKNLKLSIIIGGILSIQYGFIYIILQLENMALLVGSIGLFGILGLVMYISRNIDWYNTGSQTLDGKQE